ncbi:glycosyltransferase family 2 protein [Nakamurella flava]|uniref:Glycosyltransferase family 2 protein n=1 Tax=Nakamurella flava TaxID=2576308 RepID=A0A4U6QCD5_9ACTN|nr:glycosyltransferase [Nakamurella flava]TKV57671.1 glycosyltransferase family 2 protein [Nakamurella flava]
MPDPTWSRRPTAAVGVLVVRGARAHSPLTPVGDDADAAVPELTAAAARLVVESVGGTGTVTADAFSITVDLPDADPRGVRRVLQAAARAVAAADLTGPDGTPVRLHVGVGWSDLSDRPMVTAVAAAQHAAAESLSHNDLVARPVLAGDGPLGAPRRPSTTMTRWQIALSLLACVAAPLALMITTYRLGLDVSTALYWAAVSAIVLTVGLQFAEGFVALRRCTPPGDAATPPAATAVIAAYLPNEAETIVETLTAFRGLRYRGPLQILLAYNTDRPLPVESELARIALADPRLTLLRVEPSTSKAQNVNAALAHTTGEFVGVFDADHHPMPDAFERAWAWINDGADVVQGHCVVRNGSESAVARMVAVEFEQIYAVGHIGRQRMHGFGIFGGSNGFWRTDVLRQIRMRGDRLTEDIDSSVRALRSGYRVVNDRGLISRELAPTSLPALWKQRIRWAQGWYEVSRYNAEAVTGRSGLSFRQRLGLAQLLVWRELYMWVTPLIWSLLLFMWWRDGGLTMASPVLLALTGAVLACGPVQLLFARQVGDRQIRRHRWWWWSFLLVNLVVYQEYKNLIGRVAQIKHVMGERHWTVTPRTADAAGAVPVGAVEDVPTAEPGQLRAGRPPLVAETG